MRRSAGCRETDAGCGTPTLFASDALAILHEATLGQLRDVDCELDRTASRRKLSREIITHIIAADTRLEF